MNNMISGKQAADVVGVKYITWVKHRLLSPNHPTCYTKVGQGYIYDEVALLEWAKSVSYGKFKTK